MLKYCNSACISWWSARYFSDVQGLLVLTFSFKNGMMTVAKVKTNYPVGLIYHKENFHLVV